MSTPWKTVRVFISSTFRDMQAERDWLVRFVFPELREELLKYRIHFVDVDLRWGVTGKEDASEVCREVIGECRPRFLCILGGRYGHVPNKANKSITADEIDFGVLNPPANDHGPVRAFFYFRHEAATARMVEDYREPADSPTNAKLIKLKQAIVDAGHEPRIYGEHALWDATSQRLTGLKKFGDRVLCDLFKSIQADPKLAERFTATATPPDEFADERDAMESFIEERTERFIPGSRQQLLNALAAFATADDARNILVLTGAPGSGKSALLARLVRDLEGKVPVISHFIGASPGSTDLRRTLRRLCHELAPAEPLPEDLKELIARFHALLTGAKPRTTFVLDALNQLDTTDGAHWLNWLPREIPAHVRIITSVIAPADGQPEHATLTNLRQRSDARIEPLGPLDESDARAIIESFRERYKKRLSPGQIAALLDEKKPERFLPLYLLTALEELRTLGTDEQIATLAPNLFTLAELERLRRDDHDQILAVFIEKIIPGTALELFRWILTQRLGTDPILATHPHGGATGLVEKFAACLGVSRHGLSPAELTALLDPGDSLGNVAALLRLLRPYLMRRGELLDFYHGQFREAAAESYLSNERTVRDFRIKLAEHFKHQREGSPRRLMEWPYQLSAAKEWETLRRVLLDLNILREALDTVRYDWILYWSRDSEFSASMVAGYQVALNDVRSAGCDNYVLMDHLDRVAAIVGWCAGTQSALPFSEELVSTCRKVTELEPRRLAKSLLVLGHAYAALERHDEAADVYGEAALLFESSGGSVGQIAVLLGLGVSQHRCSRFVYAEKAFNEVLAKNPPPPQRAAALCNLGHLSKSMGRTDQAEMLYRQALCIEEGIHNADDPAIAVTLTNLACLLAENLHFKEAESLFDRAVKIRTSCFGANNPLAKKSLADLEHCKQASRSLVAAHSARVDWLRQENRKLTKRIIIAGIFAVIAAALCFWILYLRLMGKFAPLKAPF